MFAWNATNWTTGEGQDHGRNTVQPKLDARTTGMIAGTKVAMKFGWAPIETVQVGQRVLTFDDGLQEVTAITRHVLMADTTDRASWPLSVPAGALGNVQPMTILPHQPVMIESDLAEQMTGDPFALIPAASLEGYAGITSDLPHGWVEVIQLHFAQDEIVFANIGALFLCRAQADLLCDAQEKDYDVMPLSLADDLIECLSAEPHPAAQRCMAQQTRAA